MPHQPRHLSDDLDALIRSRFPYPLAWAWARAQLPMSTDAQLSARVECFGVVLRFVLLVQLADALRAEGSATPQMITALKEAHRALVPKPGAKGSTEGSYAHALNRLNRALVGRATPCFAPGLVAWQQRPTAPVPAVSAAVETALGIRNNWAHNEGRLDERSRRQASQQLQHQLAVLFEALRPLASYSMAALLGPPTFRGDHYIGRFALLSGEGSIPRPLEAPCPPGMYAEGEVYLLHPNGQALLLSPFAALPDRTQLESLLLLKHFVASPAQVALRTLGDPTPHLLRLEGGWEVWIEEHAPQGRSPALTADPVLAEPPRPATPTPPPPKPAQAPRPRPEPPPEPPTQREPEPPPQPRPEEPPEPPPKRSGGVFGGLSFALIAIVLGIAAALFSMLSLSESPLSLEQLIADPAILIAAPREAPAPSPPATSPPAVRPDPMPTHPPEREPYPREPIPEDQAEEAAPPDTAAEQLMELMDDEEEPTPAPLPASGQFKKLDRPQLVPLQRGGSRYAPKLVRPTTYPIRRNAQDEDVW